MTQPEREEPIRYPVGSIEMMEDHIMDNNDGIMTGDNLVSVFSRRVEVADERGLVDDKFSNIRERHMDEEEMTMTTAQQAAISAMNQTFEDLGLDIDEIGTWRQEYDSRAELVQYLISAATKFDENYLNIINPEARIEGGYNG